MKFLPPFIFSVLFLSLTAYSQTTTSHSQIDSTLAKKITISGFCLCQTTVTDIKNLDDELQEVDVEEMDLCKDGFVQDSRFVNRKGYYSKKYPGLIFQKDIDNGFVSKIRLTKDFVGKLPDGTFINMKTLTVKDVLSIYPKYNTWKSRGCSDYWNLTNDTLSFFVKIDKEKKPQYPVDEVYYQNKNIEGIDLVISCYGLFKKTEQFSLFPADEPMYFLDSIRINMGVLKEYDPTEIAYISVYKDSSALKLAGKDAKNGLIYIITKAYARDSYWSYFKSKSQEYQKIAPDLKSESRIIYILNGKVLESNYEGDLFIINDDSFLELSIINKEDLQKAYNISDKSAGVIIKTKSKK